jgi:hypothetical protein
MDSDQRFSLSVKPPLAGLAAAGLVAFAVMALASCGGTKQASKPAPTPEETAYLQNIQLMPGRAEAAQNFLQHTVTTIYGTVANKGKKTVLYLEISLTFSDIEGKPIEQRKAYPIGGTTLPLKPGESREFHVSFDKVPPMWNQAVPKMAPVRVILAGE